MKKSTSIKISVFALLSAIICLIGNKILDINFLNAIVHGLSFLAYLFLAIFISQIIYEKVKFGINVIVLFMSFSLALYSLILLTISPFEMFVEYYVLFFYWFVLLCLVSSITLVGRIIFYSPKSKGNDEKAESKTDNLLNEENGSWTCSCGTKNTGKFCSECGAHKVIAETYENTTGNIEQQ